MIDLEKVCGPGEQILIQNNKATIKRGGLAAPLGTVMDFTIGKYRFLFNHELSDEEAEAFHYWFLLDEAYEVDPRSTEEDKDLFRKTRQALIDAGGKETMEKIKQQMLAAIANYCDMD